MRFSLHILFALAALSTVTAAAALGAQQGLQMAWPGGHPACRAGLPDGACAPGGPGR